MNSLINLMHTLCVIWNLKTSLGQVLTVLFYMLSASTRHILAKHDLYANEGARCCSCSGDNSGSQHTALCQGHSRVTRAGPARALSAPNPNTSSCSSLWPQNQPWFWRELPSITHCANSHSALGPGCCHPARGNKVSLKPRNLPK